MGRVSEWTGDEDGHVWTCRVLPLPLVVVPAWADAAWRPAPDDITAEGAVTYTFEKTMGRAGTGRDAVSVSVDQTVTAHGRTATAGPAHVSVWSEGGPLTEADALRLAGWLTRAAKLAGEVNAAASLGGVA
jgi:hypothetical protein